MGHRATCAIPPHLSAHGTLHWIDGKRTPHYPMVSEYAKGQNRAPVGELLAAQLRQSWLLRSLCGRVAVFTIIRISVRLDLDIESPEP